MALTSSSLESQASTHSLTKAVGVNPLVVAMPYKTQARVRLPVPLQAQWSLLLEQPQARL
jgi:hypothetical protein